MRVIRVDEGDPDHTWIWLTAGAALGVVAGVLIARRMKGRRASLESLLDRGRSLAQAAVRNAGPIMDAALSIKDAWDDRAGEDDEDESEDLEEGAGDAPQAEDEEIADDGLDARVLEAFANDPVLSARAVEIEEGRAGAIVLHGRVRSAREVRHAVTIARGVPGVTRVRERLTVRGPSR